MWVEVQCDDVIFWFYIELLYGMFVELMFSGMFYLYFDLVEVLVEEFDGKVVFVWGFEVMFYGMCEFVVQDLNGYYVVFIEFV